MLPYNIAFDDDTEILEDLDIQELVFNSLLTLDIIICFFSAYVDQDENIVKNRKVFYLIKYFR